MHHLLPVPSSAGSSAAAALFTENMISLVGKIAIISLVFAVCGGGEMQRAKRAQVHNDNPDGTADGPCALEMEEFCYDDKPGKRMISCLKRQYKEEPQTFSRKCFDWLNVQVVCQDNIRSVCPGFEWGTHGAYACIIAPSKRPAVSPECNGMLPQLEAVQHIPGNATGEKKKRKKKRKKKKKKSGGTTQVEL